MHSDRAIPTRSRMPWGVAPRIAVALWLLAPSGCGEATVSRHAPPGVADSGYVPADACWDDARGPEDARELDASAAPDASVPLPEDAGLAADAGASSEDAATPGIDGGPPDAGPPDAGPPDAGPPDAGPYGLTGRAPSTPCVVSDPPPPTLAATGCYRTLAGRVPADGLVEYSVNSLLWADGTLKRRFLVVPAGATIGYADDGVWDLPVGTILIKEFLLETRSSDPSSGIALETRFLVRRASGWSAVTYKWNDAQTGADRYSGGRDTYTVTDAGGAMTTYEHWFPSESECAFCHNASSGVALGLRAIQMNRDFDYGAVTDNQLRALENAGYFRAPLPGPAWSLPSMPEPADTRAPLAERARSYLEGNCAHCHHPGGPADRSIDLRYTTPFATTNTCDIPPEAGDLGIAGARIIAPGAPDRSVLHARATRRGFGQMPLVGTLEVDAAGTALLRSWIAGMTGCP